MHRRNAYRGPLRCVILDWAGTAVDHGSVAPTCALVESFRHFGLTLNESHARGPMGTGKREHIRSLCASPEMQAQWRLQHGRPCSLDDADRIYAAYLDIQPGLAAQRAEPVAGLVPTVTALRQRGIRIGSTTGYPRAVVSAMQTAAAAAGYRPDVVVCDDDVSGGRPAPWMALEVARRLEVWPVCACLVVDDTRPGIEAGRNAGMWTAGVALTGSYVGLSVEQIAALGASERRRRRDIARRRLRAAGAHFVIDSVGALMRVVDAVERKLARGRRP